MFCFQVGKSKIFSSRFALASIVQSDTHLVHDYKKNIRLSSFQMGISTIFCLHFALASFIQESRKITILFTITNSAYNVPVLGLNLKRKKLALRARINCLLRYNDCSLFENLLKISSFKIGILYYSDNHPVHGYKKVLGISSFQVGKSKIFSSHQLFIQVPILFII